MDIQNAMEILKEMRDSCFQEDELHDYKESKEALQCGIDIMTKILIISDYVNKEKYNPDGKLFCLNYLTDEEIDEVLEDLKAYITRKEDK